MVGSHVVFTQFWSSVCADDSVYCSDTHWENEKKASQNIIPEKKRWAHLKISWWLIKLDLLNHVFVQAQLICCDLGRFFWIRMQKALASLCCYRILKNKFHREQLLLRKTLPRLQYVSCSQGLGESYIADSKSHLHFFFFSFYRQMSVPLSVCYFSKWLCKLITHSSEATQYLAVL